MKKLVAFISILLALLSCKSVHYTPKSYNESQIIAGSSGGVSGTIREYCLLDNGQLFMSKGVDSEWKAMRKLKKSTTRDIFKKAGDLGLERLNFKHPGNMTYYLVIKQPPRSNEIKWGESGISTPDSIKVFHHYLMTIFQP
jgi:hypothetical protein